MRDILDILRDGLDYAEDQGECTVKAEVFSAAIAEIRWLRTVANYVTDREIKPTCVWFRDGRRVSIVGKPGDHYLDIRTPSKMILNAMEDKTDPGSSAREGPSPSPTTTRGETMNDGEREIRQEIERDARECEESCGQFGHHPDPLIDAEIEVERLQGLLSEAHGGLIRALDFRAATSEGLEIKADIRDALHRTGHASFLNYRPEY